MSFLIVCIVLSFSGGIWTGKILDYVGFNSFKPGEFGFQSPSIPIWCLNGLAQGFLHKTMQESQETMVLTDKKNMWWNGQIFVSTKSGTGNSLKRLKIQAGVTSNTSKYMESMLLLGYPELWDQHNYLDLSGNKRGWQNPSCQPPVDPKTEVHRNWPDRHGPRVLEICPIPLVMPRFGHVGPMMPMGITNYKITHLMIYPAAFLHLPVPSFLLAKCELGHMFLVKEVGTSTL